jgi:Bacterial toxin 28
VLTVQASAEEPIEIVIERPGGGIVDRAAGRAVRLTHAAAAAESLRIQSRPAGSAGSARLRAAAPAAQLMIAVEPADSASTSEDGAAYLNARQHLLLNLFGVTPRALHPGTGLSLAESLDALELVARSAAADSAALPASAGNYRLEIQHGSSGAIEHAVYTLTSAGARLTLATVFDASTGALQCRLVFGDMDGVEIRGSLHHTVALADGIPVQPAADPVADYLASKPDEIGALDDFSDLTGDGASGAEGVGSFLQGALAGDLADSDSWSALGGQTAMGLVPVAGQIADLRDIAAAGADVLDGTDGAWARLGISVVAVIPGLDFLKGGSKAGRKALGEAAGEVTQGTTRSGMKQAARVLGKEAAQRAMRELRVLAVARAELLTRWQLLLVDTSLSPGARAALRRARNALQDHLQPADLAGALRDKLGIPVRASGSGAVWNHQDEVGNVIGSLDKLHRAFVRELNMHPAGSPEFIRLSKEMDAFREMSMRIDGFLEIR